MTAREMIVHRKEQLHVTPVEMTAVNLAAERTRTIWNVSMKMAGRQLYSSPGRLPNADQAIFALGCHWTRQVKLLDLALMIAADRHGLTLRRRSAVEDAA